MNFEMLRRVGDWSGDDWSNFFTILGGIALIVGAIWTGVLYIRRRIAKLEERLTASVRTMLRQEAAQTLEPMAAAAVSNELRAQREAIAALEAAAGRTAQDITLNQTALAEIARQRQQLDQLQQTVQETSARAEVGYRYVRYREQGNTLTRMRIDARGTEWRQQAALVRRHRAGPEKTAQEAALVTAPIDICEPIIANAVVNESRMLTPANPGYPAIVDAFAGQAGMAERSWPEREHAFHERLTVSCITKLQAEIDTLRTPAASEAPPDFYTQIVKICTFAIFGDIAALQRGEPLP